MLNSEQMYSVQMDDVDLIKQKVDIAELIGSYITIKKAGRNFKANCPFHNEKSPSFVISPERQIWHCFGCAKGGDIFTFVEEYDRVDFSEALKILAERAGVKLRKNVFRTKEDEKKNRIYEINHLTSQYYHYLLTEHLTGKEALSYVLKRGITEALLNTYNLGYAPRQGNALINFLIKKKGYTKEELLSAGVATIRNGRLYDFFLNRIIFPIQDAQGNIIAFSGRALKEEALPKYINTKETPVYIKGDSLFGLYQAKESIRKSNSAILMEGEFDAISSFKEGITNAIAVKGTALTENQIRLIKRFANKIIFCFDTDPAGTEAQRRSIAMIQKEGLTASVVVPPQGKDPDEILKENPLLFKKALKNEINIYDFIIESAKEDKDPSTVEGKKHILSRTLPYLIDIDNEIIKEHYLKKLANLIDASYESVLKESFKIKSPKVEEEPVKKKEIKDRQSLLEDHLLTLILQSQNPKDAVATATKSLDNISLLTPHAKVIFDTLKEYFITSDALAVSEVNKLLHPSIIPTFDLYFLKPIPNFENNKNQLQEIEKTAINVKHSIVKKLLNDLALKIKEAEKLKDEEELQKLHEEFNGLAMRFK